MPTERDFKGAKCRYYRDRFIWVSYSGNLLAYNYKGKTSYPKKEVHPNGRMYVKNAIGATVFIDEAVITCWCKPCPNDGKKYVVNHIDGNLSNNYYKNLEWVPYHYQHTTTDTTEIFLYGERLTVSKDGEVWDQKGQKLQKRDDMYDPDVDLFCYVGPYITIDGHTVFMDDIMTKAGYVNGDDADMICPSVLHRDCDSSNCSSSNLEFYPRYDSKYDEHIKKEIEFQHKKTEELNPGRRMPWQPPTSAPS